jgi:hypothetical protein
MLLRLYLETLALSAKKYIVDVAAENGAFNTLVAAVEAARTGSDDKGQ